METKEVIQVIEELTSLKLIFKMDDNEFQRYLDIDHMNLNHHEVCNGLKSFFLQKYLDDKEDFLNKIKSILSDGLATWREVSLYEFNMNFTLENTNKKTNLTKKELLRIAEIKVFHISGLIENIEKLTTNLKQDPLLKLSDKLSKVDLIRIINVMYELKFFEKTNGERPNKKELMESFGLFFNLELSSHSSHFTQALSQPLEANLKVFEDMKIAIQKIHYSKEK